MTDEQTNDTPPVAVADALLLAFNTIGFPLGPKHPAAPKDSDTGTMLSELTRTGFAVGY